MNKRQREILQAQLDDEKEVLRDLKKSYKDSLNQINHKIELLMARNDAEMSHVIYQAEHQRALKTQVQAILEELQTKEFETISEYLAESYKKGHIGVMYDLAGQGMPMILPIDQKLVVDAIKHETKLTDSLYTALGKDIKKLQKEIAGEISRGISSGLGYPEIARNVEAVTNIPLNKAMTIARTESHRINCKASLNAMRKAKAKGADIVKQWDSTLDGNTRPSHRKIDGQIRDIEDKFEVNGHKAMHPGGFGRPEEDINCRCSILQRARWALDEKELKTLKERAEFFGLDKNDEFEEFKNKYLKAVEIIEKTAKNGIILLTGSKQFGAKVGKHAVDFGLDPGRPADRTRFEEIINDVVDGSEKVLIGPWRGQTEEVLFYVKGQDVVVTKQNGEFITILKGGVNNARVKNARIKEV
ncbi:MAG: hypothetical protein IKW21_04180 [Lachnospiraceae bacterium]|nr:hypothetical protein [Lachnospiraceae bacterium]